MKLYRLSVLTFFYFVAFHAVSQSLDQDFKLPIPVTAADIYAIKVQNDGKILVGGRIQLLGDQQVNNLIRLNQDGELDETFSFSSNTEPSISEIELLSTGEIIVVGSSLMKLSSSGQIINKVDSIQGINSINIQDDDKIVITASRVYSGAATYSLYRLNSDLTIDKSFNQTNSFDGWILDAALQGDKIIVAGSFSEVNGIVKNDLVRFASDGSLDTSFDTGSGSDPDNVIGAITVQPDGKILIGSTCIGLFNGVIYNSGIIRLNPNGSVDADFNTNQVGCSVSKPILQGSHILINAHLQKDEIYNMHLYRLDSSGELDSSFTPIKLYNRNNQEIAVTNSGDVIINNSHLSGNEYGLSKFGQDGQIDQIFNPEIGRYGEINKGDYFNGQLIVGGDFIKIGKVHTRNLAKIRSDGTVDANFIIDPSFSAYDRINLQPSQIKIVDDNTIFVALKNKLVKLNGKGEVDKHFITQDITDLLEFRLLENGKLVTASSNRIDMLNADGSEDLSFKKHEMMIRGKANLSIQSNGIIYTSYYYQGSDLKMKVSRLNFDGTIDQTFDSGSGANSYFLDVNVLENEEIIGIGFFDQYDDIKTRGLVKLSSNGQVDSLFINNYNITAPEYTHLYAKSFRDGFIVSTFNSTNWNYNLGFLNADGTFNTNYSLPVEITAAEKEIVPIVVNDDSLLLLSRFQIRGQSDPSFVLQLIFNNAPKIIGITAKLSTPEHTPLKLTLDDLLITNADSSFLGNFTLIIHEGDHYSIDGSHIIPDAGFLGELTVPVVVSDGKNESDVFHVTIQIQQRDQVTAVEEAISLDDIHCYPNPAVDEIFIDLPVLWIDGEIKISDISGKVASTRKITAKTTKVNVEQLRNGLYIITLSKGVNHHAFKILKQ